MNKKPKNKQNLLKPHIFLFFSEAYELTKLLKRRKILVVLINFVCFLFIYIYIYIKICSIKRVTNSKLGFFRLSNVIDIDERSEKLSRDRRKLWLARINRKNQ